MQPSQPDYILALHCQAKLARCASLRDMETIAVARALLGRQSPSLVGHLLDVGHALMDATPPVV